MAHDDFEGQTGSPWVCAQTCRRSCRSSTDSTRSGSGDQLEQAARPARPSHRVVVLAEDRCRLELAPEVDRQIASQSRHELAAQNSSRRGRLRESAQSVDRWCNGVRGVRESPDGIADPVGLPGVGEGHGNLLDPGDGVPPKRQGEPAGILVIVEITDGFS